MKTLIAVLAVIFATESALGQTSNTASRSNGNDLLLTCTENSKRMDGMSHGDFASGYCLGFVEGVSLSSSDICAPEDVTAGQGTRVVLKYLQDHPEQLHEGSAILVRKALSIAFPCGHSK
jgi:hypothetical protein